MFRNNNFLVILITLFLSVNIIAQGKQSLLVLDEKQFQEKIQKTPDLFNRNDWLLLQQWINSKIINENLDEALTDSKKALLLAENLKDKLLIARSCHVLGNVNRELERFNIADSYYERSMETYSTLENSNQLRIEAGFLMTDWASLYSDSYFGGDQKELTKGLEMLYLPLELSNTNPTPEFNDLKYQTYLKIGKGFGVSGNFVTQIIWLEKLKSLISGQTDETKKYQQIFELNLELQRAYRRIGDYEKSWTYLNALNDISKKNNTANQLRYLRELADFYTDISAFQKISGTITNALEKVNKSTSQFGNLYTFKVLNLLKSGNIKEAKAALNEIVKLEKTGSIFNQIDLSVIRAIISWSYRDDKECEKQFHKADDYFVLNNSSWRKKLFILYWKSNIALAQKDFNKLKTVSLEYLDVAKEHNSKDSLPFIYLNLAKAEKGLGNLTEANKAITQASLLIDTKRTVGSAEISVGIVEMLYEVYQLQTDLNLGDNKIAEAFQSSENLKGRWLNNRIAGNPMNQKVSLDPKLKSEIFDLSLQILKTPKDESLFEKLSELEKKAIFYEHNEQPKEELTETNNSFLLNLGNSPIDGRTAIISYSFANDGKLRAFVWQRGKELQAISLTINSQEVEKLAMDVQEKIKTFIFFKNEGQQIYDKILRPLNVQADHLIIIPDQALWKIPFQALSADGKTYLIENTKISYAPSVSILLNQLNKPPLSRKTFQAFSNSRFNSISLKYADVEATGLADLFGVKPHLNTTSKLFSELSDSADILHFSMHAEVNKDEAFNSYLGFKPIAGNDGKFTVDDLLKIRLKKQSLVFLASCDTTNVLKSEGLVSLAWGMMAAGASTVISTQWEANDKSTGLFSKTFYEQYKQGLSSAEALQKASLELIRNKSGNMHEPYYWADFTLNGDFR